jgi:predicted nucleotidyltransferase
MSLESELLAVHRILEEEGVAHALCGGIAANLYREEIRATVDVDLCVVCSAPGLVALSRTFEERGWTAHPAWRQAELLRLRRDDHPRVDLLVAATSFERRAVERAASFRIGKETMRVLTPEDLIVFKLVAGRSRDFEAVAAIINTQGTTLDADFISASLSDLGLGDRWERALDEAQRERDGS